MSAQESHLIIEHGADEHRCLKTQRKKNLVEKE